MNDIICITYQNNTSAKAKEEARRFHSHSPEEADAMYSKLSSGIQEELYHTVMFATAGGFWIPKWRRTLNQEGDDVLE